MERFDAKELENDIAGRAAKRDGLSLDKNKYSDAWSKYQKMPYWRTHHDERLLECRMSMERLLWYMQHPAENLERQKKVALHLSLRQLRFAKPSADESTIDGLLATPHTPLPVDTDALEKGKGEFYVFPELDAAFDFAALRVGIKANDLTLKAIVATNPDVQDIDKVRWEAFWRAYNLVQEDCECD